MTRRFFSSTIHAFAPCRIPYLFLIQVIEGEGEGVGVRVWGVGEGEGADVDGDVGVSAGET